MSATAPAGTEPLVREVTARDFGVRVERGPRPIVALDGPHCRAIRPTVEGLARDSSGRIGIAVEDGEDPWTVERDGVRGTATFPYICHGRPVREIVGAIATAAVRRFAVEFESRGGECIRRSTGIDCKINGQGRPRNPYRRRAGTISA